jgi:16S rRNA (cytosine1402-N4)-methyltransferase
MNNLHIPVLLVESIKLLDIKPDGIYIDCTGGRGGHSSAILANLSNKGKLICLDIDDEAIEFLKAKFKKNKNVEIHKSNFRDIKQLLKSLDISGVDGLIADVGVSSPMFDNVERGFTYHNNTRLDMRMDQSQHLDAEYIINHYTASQLIKVFRTYGEINNCQRVVNKLVQIRKEHKISTTAELVEIIKSVLSKQELMNSKHPAKLYFQALRIETNDELNSLEKLVDDLPFILKKNGRAVIISFHSLEDRIIKDGFNQLANVNLPKEIPLIEKPKFSLLNNKPIIASQEELSNNKRAHSAKLRGIIKNV